MKLKHSIQDLTCQKHILNIHLMILQIILVLIILKIGSLIADKKMAQTSGREEDIRFKLIII
jgi:hypothetical protein